MISPQRRQEILGSLRRGTVPQQGLDLLAVGLEPFAETLLEELDDVARGGSGFKAVRGEYGCGKTFLSRWLQEQARRKGFVCAEVQISETETPLHRMETVYRRAIERLSTTGVPRGALRSLLDAWFYTLEEDVLAEGLVSADDSERLSARTLELMESRLDSVARSAPSFAATLRGYRQALDEGDGQRAEGLIAWLSGQPNVAAAVKRSAGVKGDVDHYGALSFLEGLLIVLRDSGHPGLVLVLDEVETLQRVRRDVREKGLNSLRQWIDEVDGGRFPGLYLVITGTPAFYDGPQGVQRLAPLAQRLNVDFATEARFDNPRAVQIRLAAFDQARLEEVGRKVRDLFAEGADGADRLRSMADDTYIADLARAVTGRLGGKVGIAPRVFLKKLVADVLDRIDQFPDFDPREHYQLTVDSRELTAIERGALSVDDIRLPS